MVKIVDMQPLNPTLTKITFEAPHIAKKVKAGQFGIMSIPTLLVIKNGQVVNQIVGARPKAEIVALLK